ncbi:MAG: hypothetical protein LBR11_00060 [Deltaproteobacteria bacterium]|jgi:hypothetical protein|nr:hypothetical protein [Deltaproteobacteria bacterium]
MIINIAHHYWVDFKTATWVPAQLKDSFVHNELKNQYQYLEIQRPDWIFIDKICVFLVYFNEKDIFGRPITSISFGFLKNCVDPDRSARVIRPALLNCSRSTTQIDLNLPWENTLKTQIKYFKNILLLFFTVFIFVILYKSLYKPINNINRSSNSAYHEQINHDRINNFNNYENNQSNNNEDKLVTDIKENNKEKIDHICFKIDPNLLFPCPRKYFNLFCDSNIKYIEPFNDWRKEEKECNTYNRLSSDKNQSYLRDNNSINKTELVNIFIKGRKNENI